MNTEKFYTTQLQAGLGMIPETLSLLRLWEPGLSASRLSDRAIETGVFSRATARRTRNIVAEMFAPRFLIDGGIIARRLKYLLEHQFQQESLIQIFFLQTARSQLVFRDFVIEEYWPKYTSGIHVLTRADGERFIHRSLDSGKMYKRWSESTIRRVSGYLLGCCADFGLIDSGRTREHKIKRFTIRPETALYLAYDLHFAGLSDMAVVLSLDWRLFGMDSADALRLLKTISQDGHMLVQSAADLVQVSWKYRTMEECLNALTQG